MEVLVSENAASTSTPVGLMADPAVPTAQPAMVVIAADGKETEETGYDGSAPLRVRFEARATDYGTRTPLYEWQFHREGSSTPFLVRYDANTGYEFTESGTFTVRLLVSFVENGDTVTYTQNDAFRIAISESKLEFPNAFTPNGDGINDVFKAKEGYKSIVRFRALIFNRWGRLAQMAALYVSGHLSFAAVRECEALDELRKHFVFSTLPYWETHYSFGEKVGKSAKNIDNPETTIGLKNADSIDSDTGKEEKNGTTTSAAEKRSRPNEKRRATCLSRTSIDLLFINAVIPTLFAHARAHHDDERAERALEWLEQLRPESNATVRAWQEAGITARHAADSQALLQLKQHYCDRKDCLRCRFGAYFMQAAPR